MIQRLDGPGGPAIRRSQSGFVAVQPIRLQSAPAFTHFIANASPSAIQILKVRFIDESFASGLESTQMTSKLESTLFFAATVSALTLAATIGVQELGAGETAQQAVAAPVIKLEAVQITAQRQPAKVAVIAQAPEQAALIR